MPKIDNLMLFRCVQVLRRLLMKNREIGLFCNIALSTLNDPEFFPQFSQFMEANRALAPSLMLELPQDAWRSMGPIEHESLSALAERGFRFSMDQVNDLRMEPRDLVGARHPLRQNPGRAAAQQGRGAGRHSRRRSFRSSRPLRHQPDRRADRDRSGGGGSARLRRPVRAGLPVLAAAAGPRRGACRVSAIAT